ncbi:MAG: Gmad2 immunoglobulin-like domain-containing protein [Patescibacteria group bacterium]
MKANLILAVLVIAAIGAALWFMTKQEDPMVVIDDSKILSFLDCEAAGYPVMESYPRQCRTADGRTYTEELPAPEPTYVNATADNIKVMSPAPGSVTGKPITVMGEARGGWYFEASFPLEVRNAAGAVIATGYAEAQSDWMTAEFVPFVGTIQIPPNYIGEAVLVFMNDNPSGMPENARSVSFPITIEY